MTTAVPPVGTAVPPQKKRRIFLGAFVAIFIAIQALFVLWLVTGIRGAANEDEGIVALLILSLWFVVDALLGGVYGVYRLVKRT